MLKSGDEIDVWVVDRALGQGGMGSVYRCHNREARRILAAVKVLDPSLGRQSNARARFIREAEILFSLDHPGIVKVRNVRIDVAMPYLEMEFIDGQNLETRMHEGPMSAADALPIFRQVAEALAYLHGRGIRHRDIKPSNIVIQPSGSIKLVDFGIATEADGSTITQQGQTFGSLSYAPPEWLDPNVLDPVLWDVYAAGVVFWEVLSGRQAFPTSGAGTMQQQVVRVMAMKQRHPPLDPGPGHPAALRALIRDMTHPNHRLRVADAASVLAQLTTVDPADRDLTPSGPGPQEAGWPEARPRAGVTMVPGRDTGEVLGGGRSGDSGPQNLASRTFDGVLASAPEAAGPAGEGAKGPGAGPSSVPPAAAPVEGPPGFPAPVVADPVGEGPATPRVGGGSTASSPVSAGEVPRGGGPARGYTPIVIAAVFGAVMLVGLGVWFGRTSAPTAPAPRPLHVRIPGLPSGIAVEARLADAPPIRGDASGVTLPAVAPGSHPLTVSVGSCAEADAGCSAAGTCGPGCASWRGDVEVPVGEGAFEREIALAAPTAAPNATTDATTNAMPAASPTPASGSSGAIPASPTGAGSATAATPTGTGAASAKPSSDHPAPKHVGGVVTAGAFAKWLAAHAEWAPDAARAAGKADAGYLSGWDGITPPAGKEASAMVGASWAAASAYCAGRGGLAGVDDAPLTWTESGTQPWHEYRSASGRPAWRRSDGANSVAVKPSDSGAFIGFRCAR